MTQLPVGLIALIIVSILIYFGLAHRVLDRLRLSDRAALIVIAVLVAGSFINIPIPAGRYTVSLNVGGALVPVGIAAYLLYRAGTAVELTRALVGAVVTAAVIYGVGNVIGRGDVEPGGRFMGLLDSIWVYPIIAGLVAYVVGRSRRASFVAAILGIVLVDLAYLIWLVASGAPAGRVSIGGAGVFDAVVLSGIFAVLIAEVVGEVRERIQGGPSARRPEELIEGLRKPEPGRVDDEKSGSVDEGKRELESGGGDRHEK